MHAHSGKFCSFLVVNVFMRIILLLVLCGGAGSSGSHHSGNNNRDDPGENKWNPLYIQPSFREQTS